MSPAERADRSAAPDPPFDAFARIDDPAAFWARHTPGAPAVSQGGVVRAYADFAADIERGAAFLADRGVGPGDRVLLVIENGLAAATLLLAVSKVGAWAVPVNARLSPREVETIRAHARPRISVYSVAVSPEAKAHAERDAALPALELDTLGAVYRPAREDVTPESEPPEPRERIAAVLYTSGTTGAPKGIMLSHANLLFVAGRTAWMRRLGPSDRVYGVLPVSHVYGLASVLLGALYRGARIDLVPRFVPEEAARALVEDGITVFQGVPTIYAHLVSLAAARGASLSAPRLRHISVGGAPLDLTLKRKVEAMFGIPLHNGYGLTEASPAVSTTPMGRRSEDDTVGTPLPDVEIRIVDRRGHPLPAGEIGELWVRGGSVMKGYYRDPKGTAEVLTPERWLKTGDLARRSKDGDLYIVGRLKEVIIRSGFNVYPVELEAVIASHPDVALAAVVGRRRDGNEEAVAFVQPQPGTSLDLDELAAYVAQRLAPYKRPAHYVLRATLPVTSAGKILKHKLKKELERGPRRGS
ncbi:MAG: class I adenylate-forming enzyme family protein [Kiloniellaceae bacterium]